MSKEIPTHPPHIRLEDDLPFWEVMGTIHEELIDLLGSGDSLVMLFAIIMEESNFDLDWYTYRRTNIVPQRRMNLHPIEFDWRYIEERLGNIRSRYNKLIGRASYQFHDNDLIMRKLIHLEGKLLEAHGKARQLTVQ